MHQFQVETVINAPRTAVWQALADIGNIYQWNPGVRASHSTSDAGTGVGATRYCDLGGSNYLDEEVVHWQPNEAVTMRITGTNLPFATADIRFMLREEGDGTAVSVSPIYQLKFGLLGKLLNAVYVNKNYKQGMIALLAGLKKFVETDLEAG